MDGTRFDTLAKRVATTSRRSLLKAGVGGVLGAALAGLAGGRADAAARRRIGEICRKHGDCESNACLPKDASGRRRCGECLTAADCVAPSGNGECYGSICVDGFCEFGILVDEPCGGDNLCLENGGICQQDGSCAGTPIPCAAPPSQCQEEGVCNPGTGECSYANKQNGTPCETGVPNSSGATCQEGNCVCTPSGTDCGDKECGSGYTTCGQPVSCGECGQDQICNDQTWTCDATCSGVEESCNTTADCCDELQCIEGLCGAAGCSEIGQACETDGDCCGEGFCNESDLCESGA